MEIVDYLTYYYARGTPPFRSLSALSTFDAIKIMQDLYTQYKGSVLFERFKDPVQYLQDRRQTEHWVCEQFIAKGGQPQAAYPIPMVLGESAWIRKHAPGMADTQAELRIPLSTFRESDISFTYPDSMISLWLGRDKPPEYYLPDYHGQVFILSEILAIVEFKGLPEEEWKSNLPDHLAPYIEAQVWNHRPLLDFAEQLKADQKSR